MTAAAASTGTPSITGTRALLYVIAGAAGLIFGLGLILSGMTDPGRVLAFLDVTGNWNPALAFVMGGAILVAAPAFYYARKAPATPTGQVFQLPNRTPITAKLVIGAAIFGVGWGLSGLCPGPSLIVASSGNLGGLVFVAAMGLGWVGSKNLLSS